MAREPDPSPEPSLEAGPAGKAAESGNAGARPAAAGSAWLRDLVNKFRVAAAETRADVQRVRAQIRQQLARIDPCDDPEAEPIGIVPLFVLLVAISYSLSFYWRWKFQPMQDVGHHIGMSAVVADWGRAGSLYTDLYEFPNPFNANSLLYTVAGYSGKLFGVTRAFRLCMSFYIAGIPLANLYALRVFGRSPWGALIGVPVVYYNMNYVAGFANLLFAGPFLVMSVPLLYRLLDRFTWKRFAAAAFCYVCVFLAHAHVFLWAGALGFALTLTMFVTRFFRSGEPLEKRLVAPFKLAGVSLLCVIPSLGLFARWYQWSFGAGKGEGAVTAVTSGPETNFGAQFKNPQFLWHDLPNYSFKIFISDDDLNLLWKLALIATFAVALSRLARWRRPPVMEGAFMLTMASYFLLPEGIDTNPVVGSRQSGIALWFLPALLGPVPAHASRIARYAVIVAMAYFVDEFFVTWKRMMIKFQQTEVAGLEFVMEPVPPRQRLHMVRVMSDWSKVFTWRPNWHVEKYYMSDKLGQVAENPALVSTNAIRYRKGVDPHRIPVHGPEWPTWQNLWEANELILVHGWKPTGSELETAKKFGRRIRKEGDWELWRRKGDWESGNPDGI